MAKRRSVWILLLIVALVPALVLLAAPVVAAPTADPSLTSAFALQNKSSTSTAYYTVHFIGTDGTEAATIRCQQTPPCDAGYQPLAPLGLGNFAMPASLPSGWQGSVMVESDQPLAAIVNYYSPTENTINYVFGSVNGFDDGRVGQPLYLPFILRNRNGRNTTFGIQNAGTAAANITITYYDTTGAQRKQIVASSLVPGQSVIRHQQADDSDLGDGFMGFVIATSSQSLAGSVNDYGDTNVMYNYAGSAKPEAKLYAPFIVRNRSNQNTAYLILNTNASATTVTVTYTGSAPTNPSVSVQQSLTLNPWQAWNLAQYSVPGLPDGFLGSAMVSATQPVVGIVNHSYGAFSAAGKKTTYTAVGDSLTTKNVSMPFVLRNRSNKQQGIIIQNVDAVWTNVTITFTPTAGGNPLTKTQSIPPNGFWNFGTGFAEFAGLGNGFYGTATATSDSGRIVALVNTWNDTTAPDSLGTYTAINY